MNDYNARIYRMVRGMMFCYARRWRVVRQDPVETATARYLLASAIRMRDLSHLYQANPI